MSYPKLKSLDGVGRGSYRASQWPGRDFTQECVPRCNFLLSRQRAGLILRRVNFNPGTDLENVVSIRLRVAPAYAVWVSLRPLAALADVRILLDEGRGPKNETDLLLLLVRRLNEGIRNTVRDTTQEPAAIEYR